MLLVDPELESSLKGVEAEHRFGTGEEYEQLLDFDTEPRAWAEPDEDATATINYTVRHDRPPQGRADDPPQPVGQRGHLRHAHAGQ